MADLDAVEARIWALLEPYRAELEDATIYGMPSLRWPGSGSHDYFPALDDEVAAELETFLRRLYQPYREHHATAAGTDGHPRM